MLPVYFIILPLFFAFLSAGLRGLKCVKKGWLPTIYLGVSTIMSLFMFNNLSDGPINQIIVVAPPLGINLYAGNFSVIVILAISLFGMILTSSPKLRSFFSESNAANILVLLHFAGINGLLLSGDLFNIFVFLEIVSLSAYAITAFNDDSKSFEAAIKYIIVGSFVSILLLIGIAAIYYHGGTLNLAQISNLFLEFSPKVKIVIIVTIIIALLIEAEIFPFNTWVPDVYEGSGAAVSGLFSTVTIPATLYLLFRMLTIFDLVNDYSTFFIWLGLISMLVGELGALKQTNLIRLFGYSSLAQVGLVLAGFISNSNGGSLFYLINHSAIKAGLFLIVSLYLKNGNLEDLRGVGRTNKIVGIAVIVLSLSLLGLPPFSGFSGKLLILNSLMHSVGIIPVILVLVASLIEGWYLLKIISVMFSTNSQSSRLTYGRTIPLLIPVIFVVLAGVFPKYLHDITKKAEYEIYNVVEYRESVNE